MIYGIAAFAFVLFVFWSLCLFFIGALCGQENQEQWTKEWKKMYDDVWCKYIEIPHDIRDKYKLK